MKVYFISLLILIILIANVYICTVYLQINFQFLQKYYIFYCFREIYLMKLHFNKILCFTMLRFKCIQISYNLSQIISYFNFIYGFQDYYFVNQCTQIQLVLKPMVSYFNFQVQNLMKTPVPVRKKPRYERLTQEQNHITEMSLDTACLLTYLASSLHHYRFYSHCLLKKHHIYDR